MSAIRHTAEFVSQTAAPPRHPAINHQNPGLLMRVLDVVWPWRRRLVVPRSRLVFAAFLFFT